MPAWRGAFLSDNIQVTTAAYQRHNVAAEARFILAHTWGQAVVFALIGLILFAIWEIKSPAQLRDSPLAEGLMICCETLSFTFTVTRYVPGARLV